MPLSYVAPATVEEAVAALGAGGRVAVLAGGTDLLPDLEAGRVEADRIVSLRHLPWRELERDGSRLTIGSLRPLRELERDPRLASELPGLIEAVRSVGSVPLRHRATIGGNLARASPASDLIPILLALGAEVRLVGPSGPRTVPHDRFLRASRSVALSPEELIESVSVPARARCAYAWQRVRPSNDISQVGVAVAHPSATGPWAVALGGVVPRPVRLEEAEAHLRDDPPRAVDVDAAADVAASSAPFTSDRRATEVYRRRLVGVLLRRALAAAVRPGGPP